MDLSGIGSKRVRLTWVSSAEGKLFAEHVEAFTQDITALGKFDPEAHRLALGALRETLATPRVRWLMGMEKQLVEKTNVYGNTIDAERYARVITSAVKEEYEKALVVSALPPEKGLMVKDLAVQTSIPGPAVAAYLVELEHAERVQVEGYEGRDPLFIRPAA